MEKHDTRAAENLRSTFGEKDIQAVVSDNERRRDAIEQAVSASLQGEFYVMQAESGTLDDLLIYKQPWDSRGLEGVRKSLASESSPDPLGLFRETRRDDLKDLVRQLNLEGFVKKAQDFSGFAILKEIGEHRPKERNRMVVELFREILDSIRFVHTAKLGDEGYLAHRDLKPGNFLIRCNFPGLTLLTSDLGFVSGSEKENLGAKTMAVSTREPGVLAPGSYMFRSPEQLEQGYEINFQVETENTESVSTRIAFDNIGDKNIEPGDWFESDAVSALDGTTPFKSSIKSVQHDEERVVVTLEHRLSYITSYPVFHGRITRLSALHSDLFSLGCILYFLISGGKNPEKFYIKCLEPLPLSRGALVQDKEDKRADLYENCLRTAATLCAQKGGNIIDEISAMGIATATTNGRDDKLLYTEQDIEFVKELVKDGEFFDRLGMGKMQGLRYYRKHLHNTGSVPYYLFDSNDHPIPFAILYEIVRLLMRDKKDSYVSRFGPANHAPEQILTKTYFDSELCLHRKTNEVVRRIGKVLDSSMCCRNEIKGRSNVGKTRAEYFVMLRACLSPELLNSNGVSSIGP